MTKIKKGIVQTGKYKGLPLAKFTKEEQEFEKSLSTPPVESKCKCNCHCHIGHNNIPVGGVIDECFPRVCEHCQDKQFDPTPPVEESKKLNGYYKVAGDGKFGSAASFNQHVEESWEERFDKKFTFNPYFMKEGNHPEDIKSFIQQEISLAYQRGIEDERKKNRKAKY